MFKKVILIRHGEYDNSTDRLNNTGRMQMLKLANILKVELAGEENVILLSSSAERAEDSVKILSDELSIPYEACIEFWSDNRHYQNNLRACDTLEAKTEAKQANIAIVVTHLEYANSLGELIVARAGKSNIRTYLGAQKGDMIIIDLVAGTARKVTP